MFKIGDEMELTNQQWDILERHFPEKELYQQPKGRPRIDPREILEGVLWVLKAGSAWKDLPKRYPSYQTCHRRYQEWVKNGLLERLLKELIEDLESRGGLRPDDTLTDDSFASAKKAAVELVKRSEEKGAESWQLRTATLFLSGYPLQVFHRVKSSSYRESNNHLTFESSESVTGSKSRNGIDEKARRADEHDIRCLSRRTSNNGVGSNPGCKSAQSAFSSLERRRYSDPRFCIKTHCFSIQE